TVKLIIEPEAACSPLPGLEWTGAARRLSCFRDRARGRSRRDGGGAQQAYPQLVPSATHSLFHRVPTAAPATMTVRVRPPRPHPRPVAWSDSPDVRKTRLPPGPTPRTPRRAAARAAAIGRCRARGPRRPDSGAVRLRPPPRPAPRLGPHTAL